MNNVLVIKKIGGGYQSALEATSISGATGFCGWWRLAEEVLRQSGEISPDEVVVQFTVDERGISFVVEQKD